MFWLVSFYNKAAAAASLSGKMPRARASIRFSPAPGHRRTRRDGITVDSRHRVVFGCFLLAGAGLI